MDKLNDEYNQIFMAMNDDGKKIILYNAYLPPGEDHSIRLESFLTRMKTILIRFKDAKLIVFGDFNMTRDKMKVKVANPLKAFRVKRHMNENVSAFTR
jgi:hypothetical protein